MAGNSKNFLSPYLVFNAVSTGASATSSVTDVRYLDNLVYSLSWTGTTNGTFDLQWSPDYALGSGSTVLNAGTWFSVPLSGTTNPSGSAATTSIFVNQIPGPYLRVVFTRVSGTGALTGYITGKAV